MKLSTIYNPTQKTVAREAESFSCQWLLKAGLMRKSAPGYYNWLPLGVALLESISDLVTGQLQKQGANQCQVRFPHTPLFSDYIYNSFQSVFERNLLYAKDVPLHLYFQSHASSPTHQSGAGVLNAREQEVLGGMCLADSRDSGLVSKLMQTWSGLIQDCGITHQETSGELTPGHIRFWVPSKWGGDTYVICPSCKCSSMLDVWPQTPVEARPSIDQIPVIEMCHTPDQHTVGDISAFFNVMPHEILKTLLLSTPQGPVAVLLQGDRQISMEKLKRLLNCEPELAPAERVVALTGAEVGFAGPVGLPSEMRLFADWSVLNQSAWIAGANRTDYHMRNCTLERDFCVSEFADLSVIIPEATRCLKCGDNALEPCSGITLGMLHIHNDEKDGNMITYRNGETTMRIPQTLTYQFCIDRLAAVYLEQHADDPSFTWLPQIHPVGIWITLLSNEYPELVALANRMHTRFEAQGIRTVLDNRDVSAGVKFTDADLLAAPIRIVLGKRTLESNQIEYIYLGGPNRQAVSETELMASIGAIFNVKQKEAVGSVL